MSAVRAKLAGMDKGAWVGRRVVDAGTGETRYRVRYDGCVLDANTGGLVWPLRR